MGLGTWFRSLFAGSGSSVYRIELTPEAYPQAEGLTPRELYSTQANLHAVVSFLADSIAQLPLKLYKRNSETDRQRDRDSVAAKLLWKPNNDQTEYEFWNALMIEFYLFGTAFVWVIPDRFSESGYQMRIIPRDWIEDSDAKTVYGLDKITVRTRDGGSTFDIPRSEFVQFKMYCPTAPGSYQGPITALRQTLIEQMQADKFRTQIWKSSGRFNAYITRPKDVAPWDDETKKRWVEAFRQNWGADGGSAGKMPLLEDGMDIKPYQFNSKEAQYAETKQLSREDVAAAYHINPSLIWHTQTQTYASAKDNARALYNDCLGPTLQMLQQRINSFLLPMIGADPNEYVEFDLREKLKGSFEERAAILQAAVGGPYMTRNEARADNNLPPIEGGDDLIVPMNVNNGFDNPEVAPVQQDDEKSFTYDLKTGIKAIDVNIKARSEKAEDDAAAAVVRKFLKRQAASVKPKIGAGKDNWWDEERWNSELTADLVPVILKIAKNHGKSTAEILGTEYVVDLTRKYLEKMASGKASVINQKTYEELAAAIAEAAEDEEADEGEAIDRVFEKREKSGADTWGKDIAMGAATWALGEACRQARSQGYSKQITKTWVTGENPRPEHAAINGETVDVDATFSNGAQWPGDDVLGPDGTCGCNCAADVRIKLGGR